MYTLTKKSFTLFNGKSIEQFIREDTNDFNITVSILQQDEYLTQSMTYKPKDVFVDIGAYIGTWGVLMQSLVPDAQIIAVEPFPENVALIRKNLLYPATILDVAATGKGHKTLKVYYGNETESGLHHNFIGTPEGSVRKNTYTSEEKFFEAKAMTLNQILANYKRVRVLKTDCEGAEYAIFKDASLTTLQKIDYIIGEYHPFYDEQTGKEALLALLQDQFDDITLQTSPANGGLGHFHFKRKGLNE